VGGVGGGSLQSSCGWGGGCGGGSHQGVTPLHFCEKGVKAGAHIYQDDVLQGVLKPPNTT